MQSHSLNRRAVLRLLGMGSGAMLLGTTGCTNGFLSFDARAPIFAFSKKKGAKLRDVAKRIDKDFLDKRLARLRKIAKRANSLHRANKDSIMLIDRHKGEGFVIPSQEGEDSYTQVLTDLHGVGNELVGYYHDIGLPPSLDGELMTASLTVADIASFKQQFANGIQADVANLGYEYSAEDMQAIQTNLLAADDAYVLNEGVNGPVGIGDIMLFGNDWILQQAQAPNTELFILDQSRQLKPELVPVVLILGTVLRAALFLESVS